MDKAQFKREKELVLKEVDELYREAARLLLLESVLSITCAEALKSNNLRVAYDSKTEFHSLRSSAISLKHRADFLMFNVFSEDANEIELALGDELAEAYGEYTSAVQAKEEKLVDFDAAYNAKKNEVFEALGEQNFNKLVEFLNFKL
ncbi:hypothetical protein [Vibrio crassostreae]|uniref:hypothetical protein n=1 Tax=Vibrio crassostreae TaxID=246167 RepID=UPI001B300F8E|nr:hypothetical protein [Vibrio crassostreae]